MSYEFITVRPRLVLKGRLVFIEWIDQRPQTMSMHLC